SLFKEQFGAKAANKEEFHAFMTEVFGENYDKTTAEAFRQRALLGDYSWLPPIRFASNEALGGANGAYDTQAGVVYLNENLRSNPRLAAQTFVEEAGHHLDSKLNQSDTVGDEGEMFRRVLSGEALTAAQVHDIRTEDDTGTITVDGKEIEVEFWNPFKAVGNAISSAAKAVGNAISGAAKAVGNAVVGAAKGVADGVVSVVKGVAGGVKSFVTGIGEGVGGFFSNVFKGNFGDAVDSLVRGADKAFIQAPTRVFNGVLNGFESASKGLL
ncbi:uncharacterized protein METZ01_LOCUS425496, partial [marine metagenome]